VHPWVVVANVAAPGQGWAEEEGGGRGGGRLREREKERERERERLELSLGHCLTCAQALQDMELSYKNTGETKAGAQEEDRMELQKIRLALARGLAKAFQAPPPLH